MRNLWNGVVNWVAALVGAIGGAPHPMVATDDVSPRHRGTAEAAAADDHGRADEEPHARA